MNQDKIKLLANLQETDLQETDLWGANLRGANLQETNLWGANLWGANTHSTCFSSIFRNNSEKIAEKKLQKIITKEQFESYFNYGYINENNITFSINELVYTPQGIYCLEIQSNEKLPRADRIIHRLLLYRHNKKNSLK